ncbi:hypothetical protein GCM10027344_01400 [Spelaeicoccus albus]
MLVSIATRFVLDAAEPEGWDSCYDRWRDKRIMWSRDCPDRQATIVSNACTVVDDTAQTRTLT